MFKAVRLRLYPTKIQEQEFIKNVGCCRWIYNHFLTEKIKHYDLYG